MRVVKSTVPLRQLTGGTRISGHAKMLIDGRITRIFRAL